MNIRILVLLLSLFFRNVALALFYISLILPPVNFFKEFCCNEMAHNIV